MSSLWLLEFRRLYGSSDSAGDFPEKSALLGADGWAVTVLRVEAAAGEAVVHDLTVAGLHTFYVEAGGGWVLVHNACGPNNWGRASTLTKHFRDHGADFGAKTEEEYASMASEFFLRSQREGLPTNVDGKGVLRFYDPVTNTFGAYNPDGTTRTYYKPTSPNYWDRQDGNDVWSP